MFNALLRIMRHEITSIFREAHAWLTPILFFIITVCLFPLALGSDDPLLNHMAPCIIWISALLAILMSIGNLFRQEAEEGYLDVLILSSHSLTLWVLCKMLTHWILYCLPLILISPLLGILLHLNTSEMLLLISGLLLGTPVLILLGGIGAALLVGIRGSGLLLPILIMPLYIPVLIFGPGILLTYHAHLPITLHFAMMGAFIALSLAFAPLLTSVALRLGVNSS